MIQNGKKAIEVSSIGEEENYYKTALYVRLSVLNSHKEDSDSIENQEILLWDYVAKRPEFRVIDVYRDNGETGVQFQRPAFEQLIEDVKQGKIDCIIVKDLSRFGRNYIETGEYLEKIFPFLNVRFIAVNDSYDSFSATASDDLIMHLVNLTNDLYARDISQKICPVIRSKQEKGEYLGAYPLYGYLKDPTNNHKLIVDHEVAGVIQNIFRLKAKGSTYSEIIEWLEENEIFSPARYRYEKGIVKSKRWATVKWRADTIKEILKNPMYLGHMVQGKKRESLFQGKKQRRVSKENWIIVKNTHEAIIDEETFFSVQKIMEKNSAIYKKNYGKYDNISEKENIFKGLIRCGCCGGLLKRYKNVYTTKRKEPKHKKWYSYICQVHVNNRSSCSFTSIREDTVKETIWEILKMQMNLANDMKQQLEKARNRKSSQRESERLQEEIVSIRKEILYAERLREKVYDDYLERMIDEEEYIMFRERYKEKGNHLKSKLKELEEKEEKLLLQRPDDTIWLKKILSFEDQESLTREMVVTLIKSITVYDNKTVHIEFQFQNEYESLCKMVYGGDNIV